MDYHLDKGFRTDKQIKISILAMSEVYSVRTIQKFEAFRAH